VAKFAIPKSFTNVMGPLLEFGRVDFNGRAAQATREVMMVRLNHATSVETFPAIGHHDVDVAVLDQLLQLRVDRRQRDSPTVSLDERVEFLGAHEALQLA
jgi:hypothetical protein